MNSTPSGLPFLLLGVFLAPLGYTQGKYHTLDSIPSGLIFTLSQILFSIPVEFYKANL